jgi:hypothetical protein
MNYSTENGYVFTFNHSIIEIMTITKNYNGSVTISDIKDNQYYNQTYYFYSLREAKKQNNIKRG